MNYFHIFCRGCSGTVKLPGEKFQASAAGGQSPRSDDSTVKSVVLNSAEELYADLR